MTAAILSQEIVCELLRYSPDTGTLIWKERADKWADTSKRKYNWNSRFSGKSAFSQKNDAGYYVVTLFYKNYRAHRLIWLYMLGEWPQDHINHDRTDNRWANLRAVSLPENRRNHGPDPRNKSGLPGVKLRIGARGMMYWRVFIKSPQIYLGFFDDFFEACCARKSAELKYDFHPNHGKDLLIS